MGRGSLSSLIHIVWVGGKIKIDKGCTDNQHDRNFDRWHETDVFIAYDFSSDANEINARKQKDENRQDIVEIFLPEKRQVATKI